MNNISDWEYKLGVDSHSFGYPSLNNPRAVYIIPIKEALTKEKAFNRVRIKVKYGYMGLLSLEWNKPKKENLRKDQNGKIIDTRTPRDYSKIKDLHTQINSLKTTTL